MKDIKIGFRDPENRTVTINGLDGEEVIEIDDGKQVVTIEDGEVEIDPVTSVELEGTAAFCAVCCGLIGGGILLVVGIELGKLIVNSIGSIF